ncbi:hypothetical protein IFM89_001885 [Coptis chinensis]|uniref:Uncharacterized protein n=1 Tax=Coptis chinensis TaxID=261450 RepID=A0A835IJX5_9MAGN|nr:hypothetical protein IFM89_001885 [Coptis chinensis]
MDFKVTSDEEGKETIQMEEVLEDVEKAKTSSKNVKIKAASTSMQEQEQQKLPSDYQNREVDVEPGYDPSQNGGPGNAWLRATLKVSSLEK